MKPIDYPPARHCDQTDDYHGVSVADPYRWLEDLDAEETQSWVEAQNRLVEEYLNDIPERSAIRERLTKLWDYEKYGLPFEEGGRFFFMKNDGLQNQSVLYAAASPDGEARVLLDPNGLSDDGTVALSGFAVSRDGGRLAYGLSSAGSDWMTWKVRDVATGVDLEDRVEWVKFSGASWDPDGGGFYYSRYDEPSEGNPLSAVNVHQKLYHHRVGEPQSRDRLIYERPDEKEWGFQGHVTEDGGYLIVSIWQGTDTRNRVYYRPIHTVAGSGDPVARADSARPTAPGVDPPDTGFVKLLDDFDAAYGFVGNDGPVFYFTTDLDAPRGRLIAIDTRDPDRDRWRIILPETEETLESVTFINDSFVAVTMRDAHTRVRVYETGGQFVREIDLPGIGTAGGFGGKRRDTVTYYSYTGFTTPPVLFRLDLTTGESTLFRKPDVDFNPEEYETKQVFVRSGDGTMVPMFLTHRKGLPRDGSAPALLYAYGGFRIPVMPSFSLGALVWMEMGGIYAVANLRGGGEYGEEWHRAGMKRNKQNVFDDFIAAAEWLVEERFTSRPKLAIAGGSNGGLLVGAVMTQRPDLFGAALPAVGVMDMLRFPRFSIGWAWESEYGSPDDPDEFRALYAYSPLHAVRKGIAYPPTLITTGDHDDRVWPGHSYKFAAAMQAAQAGPSPILIRVETRAGHGAGKPTDKLIEETADRYAFLVKAFGMREGAATG